MDRNNIIGLVLITVIVVVWLIWNQSNMPETPKVKKADTSLVTPNEIEKNVTDENETVSDNESPDIPQKSRSAKGYGKYFTPFLSGTREVINIETDLVKAMISTKGAVIINWELKEYKKWDGVPSQLISDKKGELFLKFWSIDAKNKIDTRDLYFEIDNKSNNYQISGDQTLTLTAKLKVESGKEIIKKFTFHGDEYIVDTDIQMINMTSIIPRGYEYFWAGGISYQEKNSVDESNSTDVRVSLNGELDELDASDDEEETISRTGLIDFAAIKTKYFAAAIIPLPLREFDGTVDLYSHKKIYKRKSNSLFDATVEKYDMSFRMPYRGGQSEDKFKVFIGPLDYNIVQNYGLEKTVDMGWEYLIRPIGEYFMLPIFQFIHVYVPNYGIAIIIFSLLMKLLLYPLSIQQMRSAQKMKLLGPEMQKLRDKFKDDNTKQQQATMKLYQEYGVNPAGGCLPLLFQMPVLIALWSILRTAIDLRQADFMLWINDLSIPDAIISLGFKLPIFGMSEFSGLAIMMGITMFFQQKLTITDPRQKAMIYVMPVMFTLLFSSFPSGLNLYYFFFNVWSIGMQIYINKFSGNKVTLAEMKKAPKKPGWIQKKMAEAQQVAADRGKSVPGKKHDDSPGTQAKKKISQKKSSPTQGKKKR